MNDAGIIPTAVTTTQNYNATCETDPNQDICNHNNFLGLLSAISSSIFIGTYWILNKKSLEHINASKDLNNSISSNLDKQTTGSGTGVDRIPGQRVIGSSSLIQNNKSSNSAQPIKYEFLYSRLWWFGMLCMFFGELANFAAYIFSPAALVTPLGALSVVVTCVLSEYFLDEKMNLFSKLGVLLAVLGSIFIVLHAPKAQVIDSLDDLKNTYILSSQFMIYATIVLVVMIFLVLLKSDHYFYKILLSSLAGGFCVISTKCLGIAVVQINKSGLLSVLSNWFFYLVILSMLCSISIQIVQITRALNTESASTVMPIFYITFTISVVSGMNVLFKEYNRMTTSEVVSVFIGFSVLCCAVFLLRGFSDLPIYKISDIEEYSLQIRNSNVHMSSTRSCQYNNQRLSNFDNIESREGDGRKVNFSESELG